MQINRMRKGGQRVSDNPFDGLVRSRPRRRRRIDPSMGSPPRRPVERPDPVGQEYMLLEDLRLHALPYGSGADDGFTVDVTSANAQAPELILNALPVHTYRHWRLTEALRDYMQTALWYLVQGDFVMETAFYHSPEDEAAKPVAFQLDVLQPELIARRFGGRSYWTPTDSDDGTAWTQERLSPNDLVVVSLPRQLRRDLERALRAIRATDQDLEVMERFTYGKFANDSGFDFKTYQRLSHDIVLRATRSIGWAGRGLLTEGLLDPMKVWRAIQFARFQVRLRNAALQGLRTAIDRAGETIGFEASIQLSGVLTEADLDQLEQDLRAGSRPIAEMFLPKVPT